MGLFDFWKKQTRNAAITETTNITPYPFSINAGEEMVTRKELAMKIAAVYNDAKLVSMTITYTINNFTVTLGSEGREAVKRLLGVDV